MQLPLKDSGLRYLLIPDLAYLSDVSLSLRLFINPVLIIADAHVWAARTLLRSMCHPCNFADEYLHVLHWHVSSGVVSATCLYLTCAVRGILLVKWPLPCVHPRVSHHSALGLGPLATILSTLTSWLLHTNSMLNALSWCAYTAIFSQVMFLYDPSLLIGLFYPPLSVVSATTPQRFRT